MFGCVCSPWVDGVEDWLSKLSKSVTLMGLAAVEVFGKSVFVRLG